MKDKWCISNVSLDNALLAAHSKIHLTDSIMERLRLKSELVPFVNFADSRKFLKNFIHHQYSMQLLINMFR